MSDKIYSDVFFPSMNKTYGFVLPINMKLENVIKLMAEIIREKEQIILETAGLMLYDMGTQTMLDAGKTVYASEIVDGTKLMLV